MKTRRDMQLTNKLNNSTYTELSLLCDKLKKKKQTIIWSNANVRFTKITNYSVNYT